MCDHDELAEKDAPCPTHYPEAYIEHFKRNMTMPDVVDLTEQKKVRRTLVYLQPDDIKETLEEFLVFKEVDNGRPTFFDWGGAPLRWDSGFVKQVVQVAISMYYYFQKSENLRIHSDRLDFEWHQKYLPPAYVVLCSYPHIAFDYYHKSILDYGNHRYPDVLYPMCRTSPLRKFWQIAFMHMMTYSPPVEAVRKVGLKETVSPKERKDKTSPEKSDQ